MLDEVVSQDWLIIANGAPLEWSQLINLAHNKLVLVLDGAINASYSQFLECLKIRLVLGDFDSIDKTILQALKDQKHIRLIHTPDQNATDLEKGIRHLLSLAASSITICQATGYRLDHTLYNLRLLKRFALQREKIRLVTETEVSVFLKDESVSLTVEGEQPVALLAFPAGEVTSNGLKYDMTNFPLIFAKQESTSNTIVAQHAEIEVKGEALLIINHATRLSRHRH